ncbi:glycerol-3-phosphate dehydrogenase SDP6, mitochondrial-like protein [Tanacetum coccineum]
MQDLTATFDNILEKLSQEDEEGTKEAVEEGMNGVGHDIDYDASISGKEADLETFMEMEKICFRLSAIQCNSILQDNENLVDFIARRSRLAFLDTDAADRVLPRVIEIQAAEHKWGPAKSEARVRVSNKVS